MATRKQRSDSATAQAQNFSQSGIEVQPPDGIELNSDVEKTIWRQFSKCRAACDWRDFDLVLLAKIVKLEAYIRKHQATLDASGPLIKNKRETLVENPLLRVIDTLQRQQMAIIRSMSLNQTDSDPRTLNAIGKTVNETQNVLKEFSVQSLIAMPGDKK